MDERLNDTKNQMIEMVYNELATDLVSHASPTAANVEILINDLDAAVKILRDIKAIETWEGALKVQTKWDFLSELSD